MQNRVPGTEMGISQLRLRGIIAQSRERSRQENGVREAKGCPWQGQSSKGVYLERRLWKEHLWVPTLACPIHYETDSIAHL